MEERIEAELVEMRQARSTEPHQRERHRRHAERAVVAVELAIREDTADPIQPTLGSQKTSEQLEPGVLRQRLPRRLDRDRTFRATLKNPWRGGKETRGYVRTLFIRRHRTA